MLLRLFIIVLFYTGLHAASNLKNVYYVKDRKVDSSVITGDAKNGFTVLTIGDGDHLKKIKAKELAELLKKHGYKDFTVKNTYVNFVLKSPIDTSFIEGKLRERYEREYGPIDIKEITVEPRSYMYDLPQSYIVNIKKREHLSKEGTISIETPENKKYFFDYYIKAYIVVYESKEAIKKDTRISPLIYKKKSILLEDFRSKPLQNIEEMPLQAKRHIPKARILSVSDVEELDIVKRGEIINVSMKEGDMIINFTAEALKDAKLNDIINVQNSKGKTLKAKVTGRNMAVIE